MKNRISIFLILGFLLSCNWAISQANCLVQGNVTLTIPPAPASPASAPDGQVLFLNPDNLNESYGSSPLMGGFFQVVLNAPLSTNFIMVLQVDGLYFGYPKNGEDNVTGFTTDCGGPFQNNSGFESFLVTKAFRGTGVAVLADVLPVEFISFTARAEESSIRLDWATSFEEDNEFFTVERSFDGETFEPLANVIGAGTTYGEQNYTWIDDSPFPGISYYRIKQTDFDGAFAYSDVASVKMNGNLGHAMRIFPNPAETSIRVSIPSVGQSGTAVLRIYNHVGQLILQEERSTEVVRPPINRTIYR